MDHNTVVFYHNMETKVTQFFCFRRNVKPKTVVGYKTNALLIRHYFYTAAFNTRQICIESQPGMCSLVFVFSIPQNSWRGIRLGTQIGESKPNRKGQQKI